MSVLCRGLPVVALLALLVGCDKPAQEAPTIPASSAITLTAQQLAKAEPRVINPSFELTAITEAIQSALIKPQIRARLLANHFEGGEQVSQGQLLVELDPADYKAALGSAEAELASAQASFNQSESNWKRAQTLQPDGYISQIDFDSARAAQETARAAVAQAEAALQRAQLDLQRTRISAPFDGRISPPEHAVGDLVSSLSARPLFKLVQLDPIYVNASVQQDLYNKFALLRQKLKSEGQDIPELKVSIQLTGGAAYPYPGKFQAWDDTATTAPGMIMGRAVFPNPEHILLPGQNVTLRGTAIKAVEGVFIPQRAVFQDQQGHYVMVIDDSSKIQRRNIEVGIRDGLDWSVRSGLSAGERVVREGGQRLPPGTEVTLSNTHSEPQ